LAGDVPSDESGRTGDQRRLHLLRELPRSRALSEVGQAVSPAMLR
jgi:hypothetical protein